MSPEMKPMPATIFLSFRNQPKEGVPAFLKISLVKFLICLGRGFPSLWVPRGSICVGGLSGQKIGNFFPLFKHP